MSLQSAPLHDDVEINSGQWPRVLAHWRAELAQPGFCYVPVHQMRAALGAQALAHWAEFAASWRDLALDEFMADAGRYRKRRHAIYHVSQNGNIARQPAAPHFQSLEYNPLNGGVPREFAPIDPAVGGGPVMHALLRRFAELVAPLAPAVQRWHAQAHQFRIEPTSGQAGQPTPEGVHRDGVDFVLVLMIGRDNIAAGTTTVHEVRRPQSGDAAACGKPARRQIGSFTLAMPLEAVWLDDNRLFHGVTAVHAKNPALPAYRDVLVLTLKAHS